MSKNSIIDQYAFFVQGYGLFIGASCIVLSMGWGLLMTLLGGAGCMAATEGWSWVTDQITNAHWLTRYRIWRTSNAGYKVREELRNGVRFFLKGDNGDTYTRTVWSLRPVLRTEWRFASYTRWRACWLAGGFRMSVNCYSDSRKKEWWDDDGSNHRVRYGAFWPNFVDGRSS